MQQRHTSSTNRQRRTSSTTSGAGALQTVRITYLCHGPTYASAKATAAAVLTALDERRGIIGGLSVGAILSESEADAGFYDELHMHVVAVDFAMRYQP